MDVYTYSEARTKGEVRIKRRDGQLFVIKPEIQTDSPLNVPGIDLGLGKGELVTLVREGREKNAPLAKRK